jgi:hypothetical protein
LVLGFNASYIHTLASKRVSHSHSPLASQKNLTQAITLPTPQNAFAHRTAHSGSKLGVSFRQLNFQSSPVQSTPLIILIRIPLPLLHNLLSKPTTPGIKLLPILIPNLPSTLSASILPALREPLVQITADNPLVELRAAHVLHAIQRVFVSIVLDEAEAAGSFVEAVQSHDEPLDAAAFAEELVDLLFGRVEGEVADVEGCGVLELVDGFGGGGAVVGVAAFALVLQYRLLVRLDLWFVVGGVRGRYFCCRVA